MTRPTPLKRTARGGALRRYLRESRELGTSLLLVLPLFVIYHVGVLVTGGVRNGVDFMTDALFAVMGGSLAGYLALNGAVLLGLLLALLVQRRRGKLHPQLFPWVLLESSLYASLFGTVVTTLVHWLGLGSLLAAGYGPHNAIVLSVGAGLYEEVVFRLLLMGGLYRLLSMGSMPHGWAGALSLLVSSALFSAVHHLGSLGEPFTLSAFTFRFFAGVVLASIFAFRGLGVAVYTHALYDVIVLVLFGG